MSLSTLSVLESNLIEVECFCFQSWNCFHQKSFCLVSLILLSCWVINFNSKARLVLGYLLNHISDCLWMWYKHLCNKQSGHVSPMALITWVWPSMVMETGLNPCPFNFLNQEMVLRYDSLLATLEVKDWCNLESQKIIKQSFWLK